MRQLAGGQSLFVLVITVDVVLGPLLTFAILAAKKSKPELSLDLAVIAIIQIGALGYGIHTVYVARPVAMVFEVDRFKLVTASSVDLSMLADAPLGYRELPISGPWLLGTRKPKDGAEHNDALFKGLAGNDIGERPSFWQSYEQSMPDAVARSRPIASLLNRLPMQADELRSQLRHMHADASTSRFLPVVARGAWAAVIDDSGHLLGYLPVDGFL